MDEINNLFQGFAVALTLPNIGFMFIGIFLGVLIGVLPGLGGANGVAILLPLTFGMSPTSAIIMLSCICLLYTSPSPRDRQKSRMPSSA